MKYIYWEFPECSFKNIEKNEYVCIKEKYVEIQLAIPHG